MTDEREREALVERMAEAIFMRALPPTLAAIEAKQNDPENWQEAVEDARAALDVAEPVIRGWERERASRFLSSRRCNSRVSRCE